MESIRYQLITHRNEPRILICFAHNKAWNERIKQVPGARWSSTHRGWHIPDTADNRVKCKLSVATALPMQETKLLQTRIRLSANNKNELKCFLEQLVLKKYSGSTLQTYRNEFMQLLQLLGEHRVQDLSAEHLKRYMLYCTLQLGLTENTLHSRLNALNPVGFKK